MQFAKIVIFISEKPALYKNNNSGKSIKYLPLLLMFSVVIIVSLLILCLSVLLSRAKVLWRANVKYRHANWPAYRMTTFRKSQIWVFHRLLCAVHLPYCP